MIKFAIISFPGTNCENENIRAFKRAGMEAETVLWNDPGLLDGSRCDEFDGYCIAGGFSYEDRGRSGIIAAQNPVMDVIKNEAEKGKVVLGVCNGAQVLVETGLVPGFDNHDLAAALAWNEMTKDGQLIDTGFYNSWSYLKNTAPKGRSAFNDFDDLLHIPFAHGEGRFVFKDPAVLEKLKKSDQIIFRYADADGQVSDQFPITPNGSADAIAAIGNPAGNVMAIMPHPERDPRGNGHLIFDSIRRYLENRKQAEHWSIGNHETPEQIRAFEPADIEFLVRLIIVDNAERTVEMTLKKKGIDVSLKRYVYWAANLKPGVDKREGALKILESGELANLNKEVIYARFDGQVYSYTKAGGLQPYNMKGPEHYFVACDNKDFVGDSTKAAINLHAGDVLDSLRHGVFWGIENTDDEGVSEIIRTKILYNPNSMVIMKP